MTSPSGDPPPLPDPVAPELLRDLDAGALEEVAASLGAAERAVIVAMAPFDRQLKEIRARQSELATERRRRERAARHAARIAVRAAAGSETMPTLADALAAGDLPLADDLPLREMRAFLKTGGEVAFGYPTRPGSITFTDGRRSVQATTIGDARRLWSDGLEPGAPGVPGVRVHLIGTRVERVAPIDEVVVQLSS